MTRKLRRQGCGTRPALRRAFVVGLSLSMALGGVPAYALEDAAGADGAGTDEQAGASAWQGDDLVSGNADGMAALGIDETIDEESAVGEEHSSIADEDPLEEDVPEEVQEIAEDSVKSDGGEDAIGAADPAATKKGAAVGLRSEYSIESIGDKTYTGSAIEPKPKVTMVNVTESAGERTVDGPYTLEEGTEYTLEYKNNVNVGTATVSAIDRIGRTLAEATFQIVEANVSQAKVAKVQKQAYTGKAVKPAPKVTYKGKTLKKGTDYTLSYKNNKKAGTATIIVKGKGNFTGTKKATFKIVAATVSYRAYGQSYGAQASKSNGTIAGKPGKSKRLERIKVRLAGKRVSGSIKCNAYLQSGGWQGWRSGGKLSGTTGKRMEAVKIKLTGKMAKTYNVWYRVYAQNFGWMGWAKNGEAAGSTGYSYRLEAIQIVLRPKGSKAPAASFKGAKRHTKAKFKKCADPTAAAYAANPTSIDAGKNKYMEFTGTIQLRRGPDIYDPATGHSTPGSMQYVLVLPKTVRYASYASPTKVLGLMRDGSPSSPYFAPYLNKVVTVGANWGYGAQGLAAPVAGANATVVKVF